MAEIVIEHLSKTYRRGMVALRDCTFTAPDGRCTVVVGPSGCGKTTLLRLLAGLDTADGGTIGIGGQAVNSLPPHRRDVAMVFQDFAMYPHMRVRANLAFSLRVQGVARAEVDRRIDEAAALLDITHLLDRKPGELSGGERQRAAVGRVLVRRPACALFDEPLSNLDAAMRVQLRGELKLLLQRLSITSIFVTHDQEEAMGLADLLVVMADGAVQQIAPPLDVYRRPANRFVAGFIGSPTMNFIDGSVEHCSDGGARFCNGRDVAIQLDDAAAVHATERAVLGVRPEALSLAANGAGIAANVAAVEHLGGFSIARCTTEGGDAIVVRTSQPVQSDQALSLTFDLQDVHLFEPGDFGRAIL